jgi:hypothetical protein
MTKRDFLKTGAAVAAFVATPGLAALSSRVAIVQPHLPGADAVAHRERAAGATILVPEGDAIRWYAQTLRPALRGRDVVGYTDAAHALLLEGCLHEQGYRRAGQLSQPGGALQWGAAPRTA